MDKIFKGIVEFSKKDFEEHKEIFQNLKTQTPHTLFIGCSDSRVVPNLITKTLPGELFTVRNIGNLVPPYRDTQEYVATTSAIEYAVCVLNVENIVICGHSNCGAGNALYQSAETMAKLPHVHKWLELMQEVKAIVEEKYADRPQEEKEWITEQLNVVVQLKHLFTYPFIKERYLAKKIKIFGWHYIIETGEVYNYNKETNTFELIKA